MSEVDGYVPWDPRRICDTCGELRRRSQMRKLPGNVWACDLDADERSAVELSRANARQKPFLFLPVKDARPEDPVNPDVFADDDGAIMNLIGRMVEAGTRFESVVSGDPAPLAGDTILGLSWASTFLYGVIVDDTQPLNFISRARTLLVSAVDQMIERQQGFGISTSSTLVNDAFYGGFLDVGDSYYRTEQTAVAGLSCLYAYRVTADRDYLLSARAAASYLRNVQAIGSNGTHFTSSDSAGTARLYTGALAARVSTQSGFYSDSAFYPSCLLALQLWNELKTTDGDQQIGTTGTPTGFDSACNQLISQSITDLRTFWTNGVTDAVGETYTGLSATTPREFFNAYPVSKPNTDTTGTGRWEYQDGGASTGTLITSLEFAKALSVLYAYEGASSQVTSVDDWLASFSSNSTYETPANTSDYTLARSDTGTYAATTCPSTLLLVRDASSSYAATAQNGSSLYDWGAFGLLSPLWAARHTATFAEARRSACGINYRYDDGQPTDQDYADRIILRGQCGLSYQTASPQTVSINTNGSTWAAQGGTIPGFAGTGAEKFWFEYDYQVTLNGSGQVIGVADRSSNHFDATGSGGPTIDPTGINGHPAIVTDRQTMEYTGPNLFADGDPRTVIVVCKPLQIGTLPLVEVGGYQVSFRRGGGGGRTFSVGVWRPLSGELFFYTNSIDAANNITRDPSVNYEGQVLLVVFESTGTTMTVTLNGLTQPVNQSTVGTEDGTNTGFQLFGITVSGTPDFRGWTSLQMCYGAATAPRDAVNYAALKYGVDMPITMTSSAQVNDVMRAAMFGASLRQSPRATPVQGY